MQRSNFSPSLPRLAAFCLSFVFVSVSALSTISMAHAQITQTNTAGSPQTTQTNTAGNVGVGQKLDNPLKYSDLNSLLTAVLEALIQIGRILLTLAIVWVGFRFVAARGNEEAIRSARTALMWTVIGGLILLGATAIQAVITSTVGAITS
ncbi:MAG TPA: TrbC/VirB2 family protein [Candidatus Paceibacterota bacterium]|nr:TrbC/VirB2 family protein [Candidatus Paceibacterota bacterium]